MASGNRPLSPHLQVYRWQVTSVLSILHRFTGVALVFGALLLAYWLTAAAYGPDAFARAQAFMGSWFGRLILFGMTFALFYHLANGVRHLAWDIGWGFELATLHRTGIVVVIVAGVLTVLAWIAAYAAAGKL
jgi:succinate dehydrogenase / fumarate reductase cytochrome b subunit